VLESWITARCSSAILRIKVFKNVPKDEVYTLPKVRSLHGQLGTYSFAIFNVFFAT
jgi:hypothetical protein